MTDPAIVYSRKSYLKGLAKTLKKYKGTYSVASVGLPRSKTGRLSRIWQSCLKTTLRIMRKKYGVDYILLFETSKKGYDHAHVVLMKIRRTGITRLDNYDAELFRSVFFRVLYRRFFEKSRQADLNTPILQICHTLELDPKRVVKFVALYRKHGKRIPAGHGTGLFDYFLDKPELLNNSATLSRGILQFRVSRDSLKKRLQPRGWLPS